MILTQRIKTPENVHEKDTSLIPSHQKRPTTVRDTSKDNGSHSSRPTNRKKKNDKSGSHEKFAHLPKYNENSLGEDIYSSETDPAKRSQAEQLQRQKLGGTFESSSLSPNHKKNFSGSLQLLNQELMAGTSPDHERNNSSVLNKKTQSGLIFGSNGGRATEE